MNLDIEHIVLACQRRERKAQQALYEQFAPQMLGVCMRYTHSRDDAQDVLHDGFIKIFENIGKLRDPKSACGWMRRVMVNAAIDYLTHRNEIQYCDFQQWESEEGAASVDQEEMIDTDAYDIRKVLEKLNALPLQYRMAFNMRVVDELEYDEIASQLGVKEGSARCLVSRAISMLRNKLSNN